jgi:hypothetical protein
VDGVDLPLLMNLFRKKYKVFAEIYIVPEFALFSSQKELNEKNPIYWDKMTSKLCFDFPEKLKEDNFQITSNIIEVIEANPYNFSFVSTKKFVNLNKLKVNKKEVKSKIDVKVRYIVIGRAFYDLPSDQSDKVILIANVDNKFSQEEIEEKLKKDGLNIFRIFKNPKIDSKKSSEYYIELGFYGLLDLSDFEEMANSLHILGIIESGKVVKA